MRFCSLSCSSFSVSKFHPILNSPCQFLSDIGLILENEGGGGLVTSINVNIFLTIVIFIFPKLYPICYFRSSGTFFQKHPSDFILYNRTCGMHENIDIYLVNFIFLWSWGTAVCASDTQFPHFSHTILSCFFVNFILVRNTLLPI